MLFRCMPLQGCPGWQCQASLQAVQLLSDRFSSVLPRIVSRLQALRVTCSKCWLTSLLLCIPTSCCGCLWIPFCRACREDEECRVSAHSQHQRTSAQVAQSAGRQSPQDGPSKRTVTRPAERLMHEDPASQQHLSGPASEVHVRSDVQQVGTR